MIDPFEVHPETKLELKKINNILTLEQACDIIKEKMINVRIEQAPLRGYDKHYITSILNGLIIELEEKCQHN